MARDNQRLRTRKSLLEAASRLMRQGRTPTFEEVAEEALVSRATAYRYFAGIEPLLVEAALDLEFPDAASLFGGVAPDPAERVQRASEAVAAMVRANEGALRVMLLNSLQGSVQGSNDASVGRQNRRTPLIEAALAPVLDQLDPADVPLLKNALALVIGTEEMLVFRDVLGLDDSEAGTVREWTIRALVEAARRTG